VKNPLQIDTVVATKAGDACDKSASASIAVAVAVVAIMITVCVPWPCDAVAMQRGVIRRVSSAATTSLLACLSVTIPAPARRSSSRGRGARRVDARRRTCPSRPRRACSDALFRDTPTCGAINLAPSSESPHPCFAFMSSVSE
jgi:hypothetical protein